MPANIKNNNVRALDIRLYNDEYWDFMLYKGEEPTNADIECLAAQIDMNDPSCMLDGRLISNKSWDGAVNPGLSLSNIGKTGMDNGLISYDRDGISPACWYDLYNSSLDILSGDTRFKLNPVTGNTGRYDYTAEIVTESGDTYLKLNGGFYQGFFKSGNYEVLPSAIEDAWSFDFVIRKQDYSNENTTLNDLYPNNSGIFFYIGTRAENKYAEIYNGDYDNKESFENEINPNNVSYSDYFKEYENNCGEMDLSKVDLNTENAGSTEIITDNKHLFFNRTCTGFTTDNWVEGTKIAYDIENREYIDNPFNLYNRTCTGYTVDDYEKITYNSGKGFTSANTYNMNADVMNNAFALKLNDDGSIEFRYSGKNCESENHIKTYSGITKSGLVKKGEWATIHLEMKAINGYVDACGKNVPQDRKMKLYIYVNGYLVYISEEMPLLNLRELNEKPERQEGVAYNISIGGGSQGLLERIWPNYYNVSDKHYMIEQNYAGTFIGDIQSFKMYTCGLNINQIRANLQ